MREIRSKWVQRRNSSTGRTQWWLSWSISAKRMRLLGVSWEWVQPEWTIIRCNVICQRELIVENKNLSSHLNEVWAPPVISTVCYVEYVRHTLPCLVWRSNSLLSVDSSPCYPRYQYSMCINVYDEVQRNVHINIGYVPNYIKNERIRTSGICVLHTLVNTDVPTHRAPSARPKRIKVPT